MQDEEAKMCSCFIHERNAFECNSKRGHLSHCCGSRTLGSCAVFSASFLLLHICFFHTLSSFSSSLFARSLLCSLRLSKKQGTHGPMFSCLAPISKPRKSRAAGVGSRAKKPAIITVEHCVLRTRQRSEKEKQREKEKRKVESVCPRLAAHRLP